MLTMNMHFEETLLLAREQHRLEALAEFTFYRIIQVTLKKHQLVIQFIQYVT